MSLYGTKVHFAYADRGQMGASVTHAYSSLRQKENILSDRQKHHLAQKVSGSKITALNAQNVCILYYKSIDKYSPGMLSKH